MTSHERLGNYVSGLESFESLVRSVASAGIAQASGTPKEWGGGAEGFGERIGNAFAQHVVRSTLQYGITATLHEDNRYFLSSETGFFRRTKYALRSTFLARHDNGSQSFSFSRIGAVSGSAFISRAWQPNSKTTAGDGAVTFGFAMMSDPSPIRYKVVGSATGKERSITASIRVKIAGVPIPRERVRLAAVVNPGDLRNCRKAYLMSIGSHRGFTLQDSGSW